MLARRERQWDDEEYRRMEKDLIMKFKRLSLDEYSPKTGLKLRYKKAIPRPKTPEKYRELGMVEEAPRFAKRKKDKPNLLSNLKLCKIEKVRLLKRYEDYLKKYKFPFKKVVEPKVNRVREIALHQPNFNLRDFLLTELIKAYQNYC